MKERAFASVFPEGGLGVTVVLGHTTLEMLECLPDFYKRELGELAYDAAVTRLRDDEAGRERDGSLPGGGVE